MKRMGVYKITNTNNGRIYVGQAIDIDTRYDRHLYRIKRKEHHNQHLQRSFDKYGYDVFINGA